MITFGNIGVEKHKLYQQKSLISIYDVSMNKIIVSYKVTLL